MDDYPSMDDVETIVEKELGRDVGSEFFKNHFGLIVHTHRTAEVAETASRLLFNLDKTETIKRVASTQTAGKEKATGAVASTDTPQQELVEDFSNDLQQAKTSGRILGDDKEIQVNDYEVEGSTITVEISFVRKRLGQRTLLDREDFETSFTFRGLDGDEPLRILHDYQSAVEVNAARDFQESLNEWRDQREKEPIEREEIRLKQLPQEDRINLFDRILSRDFDSWELEDVQELGLEQGNLIDFFDDVEEEDEAQDRISEILQGITNAALSGENLRSNEFVQECEDSGFYFHRAKLRFRNTDVARAAEVSIEFKGEPGSTFDIYLGDCQTISEDGTVPYTPTDEEKQEWRDTFRKAVIEIMLDLQDEA